MLAAVVGSNCAGRVRLSQREVPLVSKRFQSLNTSNALYHDYLPLFESRFVHAKPYRGGRATNTLSQFKLVNVSGRRRAALS